MPTAAWRLVLPGLLHVLLFASLAFVVAPFVADVGLGATALGVLFGVAAGNLLHPGPLLRPGIAFAARHVLAAAVVLLGLRVTAGDVLGLGGLAVAVVVGVVVGGVVVAFLLGRLLGVSMPLALLIGAGTGVCGVSAIAAVRGAVRAEDDQVAYAVAAITFLGSVGLLVYPAVQWAWHPLSDAHFGLLAGASLHSVPQAVGAGFAGAGLAAGAVATVVKLGRVALLGPLVVALGAAAGHRGAGRVPRLPVEVWGFVVLFAFGSVIALPGGALQAVATVDEILLVVALTALGLQTRFVDLRRAGARPLVLALLVWLVLLGGLFALLRLGTYGW